jgi:hypothetical protein
MCDFAYALHALGPNPYAFARQALSLPCVTPMTKHIACEHRTVGFTLKGHSELSLAKYLRGYREQERIDPEATVHCTLAFDAITVRSTRIGDGVT